MKAAVLKKRASISSFPLVIEEVPTPQPRQGEILVKVIACGVCRTDLHVIEGDLRDGPLPIIPGHQVVGTVAQCGPGVAAYAIGDLVGVAWLHQTCQICPDCIRGSENLCKASRYTGYHVAGGYAEFVVVPADYAYRLPQTASPAALAPLLCAGIIGYRALKRSAVRRDETLCLIGFGSSAHVTLQVALHWGCKVVVATRGEKHRALARAMGASEVCEHPDELRTKADCAIVFAPAGELVPCALRAIRPGGTVALAGIHMSDIPQMSYEPHLFHEKTLTSVEANTRRDGRELLELAASGILHPQVTTFSLSQANEALQLLNTDGVEGSAVLLIS